ncbi:MAG: hypothetical protein ACD_10C00710G0001 [uncultured bacterium]|nr:MAG: hypothetical protein ACD_10C00710G0001 [uncultured bacterium]
MKFSKVLIPRCERPRAETIPIVTVWPTPKGLPMARTTSPTRKLSIWPNVMVGNLSALICKMAKSDSGSLPITRALCVVPSLSET